ncbi:acyltransferase family protein [Mucilaginibacter litoreus]|uniref:Acyltransferase family protein n=1 Tax=Mucilaginibacter litoreus TaxID=1048221 RepID=A0ABW3AVS6_9SPHI
MANTGTAHQPATGGRLASLDVMRGIIMILLCGESCMVYESIKHVDRSKPMGGLINQFFHHPWHGLHFWDLVQPAFMFMAGVAMYISYSRKLAKGSSWSDNLGHILLRSLKLFICGVGLHCVYAGKPVWELWNVLTQLSFTTIVAYLIINRSFAWQLIFSVALLILTEVLYRTILMPGFDQPFVESHNFGSYVDTLLMGKINSDGWVTINCIPTAAHTIWGVLAGKLLISDRSISYKIKALIIAGLIALAIGFGLDWSGITPIIKRISTSSFAFASAGWVLLMLAFVYWFVDIKQNKKYAWIATVVGMNAIFIYLFFETVGMQWVNGAVSIFSGQMLHLFLGVPAGIAAVVSALTTWVAEWGLCYWLYKRGIFFKL